VGLELLDAAGERVATSVSEFDGYYLFERVPPGTYRLGVVASTLPDDKYQVPEPVTVVVPPGGDFVQGPTFVLRPADDEIELKVADLEDTPEVALAGEDGSGSGTGTGGGDGDGIGSGSGVGSGSGGGSGGGAGGGTGPGSGDGTGGGTDRSAPTGTGSQVAAAPGTGETSSPAPVTGSTVAVAGSGEAAAESPPDAGAAVAATAAEPVVPADAPPADVNRTLHLIYEILFAGDLFPEED
jgi:hypothetical protein